MVPASGGAVVGCLMAMLPWEISLNTHRDRFPSAVAERCFVHIGRRKKLEKQKNKQKLHRTKFEPSGFYRRGAVLNLETKFRFLILQPAWQKIACCGALNTCDFNRRPRNLLRTSNNHFCFQPSDPFIVLQCLVQYNVLCTPSGQLLS